MVTKLLYVDLETGGIPVSTGIYEVGLIATDNGRIIETLNIGLPINQERIPEGMGQGYACISDDEQYINQFKQFVAKYPYPFVAHYASFDRSFLVHYGWVDKNAEFIDTLPLFRKHLPLSEIADHKLGTIMDYYGVQVDGTLHTAISDLKGLVECVNKSGILGDFGQTNQTPQDQIYKWSNISIYTDVVEGVKGSVDGYRRWHDEVEEVTIAEIQAHAINGELYINLQYHDLDGLTDDYMQTKIQQALETVKRLAVDKYGERLNNPVPTINNSDHIDVKTIKGTPINRAKPIFYKVRIYDDTIEGNTSKNNADLEGKLIRAIGRYEKFIIESFGFHNKRRHLEFIAITDVEHIKRRLENSGLEYQLLEAMVHEDIPYG